VKRPVRCGDAVRICGRFRAGIPYVFASAKQINE
jgi:hypothetical protein